MTVVTAMAALSSTISAHSWIEQLTLISPTGQFTGSPGYIRGFKDRKAQGFSDTSLVHILPKSDPLEEKRKRDIPDTDMAGITPDDSMCRKSQRAATNTPGFPRLKAAPGSMVALRYQENGHVTIPETQKGKPPNRGSVYIYGTSKPSSDEKFLDVFNKWNENGSGGNRNGKLLAVQNYE